MESIPNTKLVNKNLSLLTILVLACVYNGGIPAPSNSKLNVVITIVKIRESKFGLFFPEAF